ncbi:MAG TPA: nicotinate-nucleotide--dimethylbenzimidazole phosphoribosyltransferase [Candidatus Limnocylindrales bacterium]|nr:nicotinate-nucleotide--dimethylbenzimidazole phosphoribosyltransferase [Candidatus Limnocylindrales bacterium]
MTGSRRIDAVVGRIAPLDGAAMAAAAARLDRLTKPPGSLGRVEELAIRLAGITGRSDAVTRPRTIVVAAADHGVAARGVSAYPPDVTRQMVANFRAGGAAISVLARSLDAGLVIVDAGVEGLAPSVAGEGQAAPSAPRPGVEFRSTGRGRGTADLSAGPAMTRDEALAAVEAGLDLAADLAERGAVLIGVGEMGIGNTTAAAALTAALCGAQPDAVTGPGTGLDEAARARKAAIVEQALAINRPDPADPIGVLAALGGLEIAVLVGVLLGGAAARVPVVLDGFITGAAALVAAAVAPGVAVRLIASHRSAEPGHAVQLDRLGLRPLLDLEVRLGEGTGAALAFGLLDAAVSLRDGMATFESAGVADRDAP